MSFDRHSSTSSTNNQCGSSLAYMPRLDGLRAVAVLAVLLEHFAPSEAIRSVSPGGAGVTLFFVLSGYLITRILFQYVDRDSPIWPAALHFYWRRFLRLSPPFYTAIGAAMILGTLQMRENWWVHALYLTNFQIGWAGDWTGGADHFWSLCTEEHFYLLWFFVVVGLPRRCFVPFVLASFVLTMAFRATIYLAGWNSLWTVLLPGNLLSLTTGAMLAYAAIQPRYVYITHAALNPWSLLATGIGFAIISLSLPYFYSSRVIFYPLSGALFFACLIIASASPSPNKALDWLTLRGLRQIGKISYGIYVYHAFLPEMLEKLPYLGPVVEQKDWECFAVLTVASILIAQLSWTFMEQPILRYKELVAFPERQKKLAVDEAPA